jgi:nitrate reductase gamma subunit
MEYVIGMVLPYVALSVFLAGMLFRIAGWLRTPVPFHLTLFPSPGSRMGKIGTIVVELVLCRTLYRADKLLWSCVWLFHLSLFMVIFGHVFGIYFLRDQFVLIGFRPELSQILSVFLGGLTGAIMVFSLLALLCRRIFNREVRRLSAPDTYFDLILLLAIAITGILMYVPGFHTELPDVRGYMAGLLLLDPAPLPRSPVFVTHFLLVNLLLLYFPFSRLVHLAGFFVDRLMLAEAAPVYPTPEYIHPRSDFAVRKIHPDIPFSLKRAVDRERSFP